MQQRPSYSSQPYYSQPMYYHPQVGYYYPVHSQQQVVINPQGQQVLVEEQSVVEEMVEQPAVEESKEVPSKVYNNISQLHRSANDAARILTEGYFCNVDEEDDDRNQPSWLGRISFLTPIVTGLASYGSWKVLNSRGNWHAFHKSVVGKIFKKGFSELNKATQHLSKMVHHFSKVIRPYGLPLIVIGLVAAAILRTAYFLKKAVHELIELRDEKAYLHKYDMKWEQNKYVYYAEEVREPIDRMIGKTEEVLNRLINHKIQQIAIIAFALIAEGVLLTGFLMAAPLVFNAGIALGTITGVVGAAKIAHYYLTNTDKQDAKELKTMLENCPM